MKKKFTLLQLFSIVDGRLSTNMDDIYMMLNRITDENLMTHHLPIALKYIKLKNPTWFQEINNRLICLKKILNTDDFKIIIEEIKNNYNTTYQIHQLKDEFDTSDFGNFMIENSLLLKLNK